MTEITTGQRRLLNEIDWRETAPFITANSGDGRYEVSQLAEHHAVPFGSPPEPVSHPSREWCDAYAAWYEGGSGARSKT